MCVEAPPYKPDEPFEGKLDGRNGADTGVYKFQKLRLSTTSGNYDTIAINECSKKGMKPLCDHPSYCKADPRATYIGQSNHIAYGPHRNQDSYFPQGWSQIKGKFPDEFCTFTGPHGGTARTLCTHGSSHAWRTPAELPEIMCVKAPPYKPDPPFSGELGSRNGAPGGKYTFQKVRITATSGNFDTVMVNECSKKGMKPLCDHPSYCRNDARSTYIGQNNHMAYPPHRNQDSYFPSGWSNLKQQFPHDFCAFTGPHGGAHQTLCTNGNSHSWYNINQARDIMCVKAPGQAQQQSVAIRTADWWSAFDRQGWVTTNGAFTAIFRNDCNELYCIEEVKYATIQLGHCYNANWWNSFDRKGWSICNNGYFMTGLLRSACNDLYCLEESKCCQRSGQSGYTGGCYNLNVWNSFDRKGWAECRAGFGMAGIYRNDCNKLYCIEEFRCCPYQ